MSQYFNMPGAEIGGSGGVAFGNTNCVFVSGGNSDMDRLAEALETWLERADCTESGYACVSKLQRELCGRGLEAAKAFFARNLESLSMSLAGSALWELLTTTLGAGLL